MTIARLPMDTLLAELEAPMPSPAGASAAAATAAIAASLVVMSGRGSPDWPEGARAAAAAAALREQLVTLGGDDVEALANLFAAFRALRAGTGTAAESDAAVVRAAQVPLEIAECAVEVALLAHEATQHGRRAMRPDVAGAAGLAAEAARVAMAIAELNLSGMAETDETAALHTRAQVISGRIDTIP